MTDISGHAEAAVADVINELARSGCLSCEPSSDIRLRVRDEIEPHMMNAVKGSERIPSFLGITQEECDVPEFRVKLQRVIAEAYQAGNLNIYGKRSAAE